MIMKVRMRCQVCLYEQDIDVDEKVDLGFIPEITKSKMRCLCPSHVPTIKANTQIMGSMVSINGVPMSELKELTQLQGARNAHSRR